MKRVLLLGLAAALFGGAAQAAEPSPRIKTMAAACMTCHGSPDMMVGDPPHRAPMIVGQRVKYILAALNAYRSGERADDIMTPQAKLLSDEDVKELAAYFGGPHVTPPAPPHAGLKTPDKIIDYCGACHTEGGAGTIPEIPILSGQHADYLEHTLKTYRDGSRKNAVMPAYARKLSDAEIKELAVFFEHQPTGLKQREGQ